MTEVLGSAVEVMTLEERCARLAELAGEVSDLLRPVDGAMSLKVDVYQGTLQGVSVLVLGAETLSQLGEVEESEPFTSSLGDTSQGLTVTVGGIQFWTRRRVVRKEAV